MTIATGEFTVTIVSQTEGRAVEGLGHMTIDKEFKGDLEGSTQGQMLTAGTSIANSAGYVAIEKVEGTLEGKKGSFILQHDAIMDRGAPYQKIVIVPDSGTDELLGISGELKIAITDGKHLYELEYELPEEA